MISPYPVNDDLMSAISENIKKQLNAEADKLIEQKVDEFRSRLKAQKSIAIGELLNSIEICAERAGLPDDINFNIMIRSSRQY